jgi:hypothetical protein
MITVRTKGTREASTPVADRRIEQKQDEKMVKEISIIISAGIKHTRDILNMGFQESCPASRRSANAGEQNESKK